MTNLIPTTSSSVIISASLQPLIDKAMEYAANSKADNTRRAYDIAWRDFQSWCSVHDITPLPTSPEEVALYLTERAAVLKVSSLQLRLTAISQAHEAAGYSLNTKHRAIKEVWAGIRRTKGTAQQGKNALLPHDIRAMISSQPDTLQGLRNKAVILLGFASAMRRSEIVSLNIEDCSFTEAGLSITLRRSKTDQEGEGRLIGVAYGQNIETCPVEMLRAWIKAANITKGPLFRSLIKGGKVAKHRLTDKSVALITKEAALAVGLNPQLYAGHSLRSGHATSAAAAGSTDRSIMKQTGHKSVAMLNRYVRAGRLFAENSSASLGL